MYVAPDKMEFRIVFDGRLVDGFTHENVRNAFQSRFGEATTCAVFGKSQAVIKKGLNREQAETVKARLAELGMDVSIEEVMPVGYGLSLVEEEGGRALPQSGQAVSRAAANDAGDEGSAGIHARRYAENETYGIRDIEAAFKGPVDLEPASRDYVLRMLPVAALTLALPLVYVLIALTSLRAVLWVLFGGRQWFFELVDPGYATVVIYTAVLLATSLFALFLFKPLIARSVDGPAPVKLDPAREQTLFALVEEITEAVGAPMPDEILVDTEVNASARLTTGPLSNELTLTIGLPLIWGADVRAVAGILAHEFGHFAQGWGMRAQYVVRWVNYWFYRQVHERDSWDAYVVKLQSSEIAALSLAGALAGIGSLVCRWLLDRLSHAANLLSFSFSRQMEFDADRYEIALLGSDQYARTVEMLTLLSAGRQVAVSDLGLALDAGKLVDNLPRMAAERAQQFDEAARARIRSGLDEVNTSVYDTHPSDRERIRRAEDAAMEAKFDFDGPATGLVRDLERLSSVATLQWYRAQGITVEPDDLLPLESFESESERLRKAGDANKAYFGDLTDFPLVLPIPDSALTERISTEKLVAGLGGLREKYRSVRAAAAGRRDRLYLQREYQRYYELAGLWGDAGFPVDTDTFRLKLASSDPKEIGGYIAEHRKSEKALAEELQSVADLLGKRLGVGLELAGRLDSGATGDIELLRTAYAAVSATFGDARELEDSYGRLEALIGFHEQFPDKKEFRGRLDAELARNAATQERIRKACARARDPFKQELTLDFALPDSPSAGTPDPHEILEDGARMLRQLERISFRVRGRMAELALAAERHHRIL